MDKLAQLGGTPISPKMIPLVKPTFTRKDSEDIEKILKTGYVRMGSYTKEFEEKFAKKVGAKYAYAVSNGTAALHTSYLSFLQPGDEVIAPAFTFIATISTVYFSNAKPVLADVDPKTYLLDVEDVKKKITNKTKAIAPVHLFGNSADMRAIREIAEDHSFKVVNDCAQAHGTLYDGKDLGSFKDLNCYSFYPTKSMTTGEGGMVTTNDPNLYKLGCLIRSHGDDARYHHVMFGLNYRPTDIASAIGLNQLEQLDSFIEKRRHIAQILTKGLSHVDGVHMQEATPRCTPSYSYYTIDLKLDELRCNRDTFMEALKAENIDCAVHYPTALTKQPVVEHLLKPSPCPISEDLTNRILSLPMHPYLSDEEARLVVEAVNKVASHYHK